MERGAIKDVWEGGGGVARFAQKMDTKKNNSFYSGEKKTLGGSKEFF